MKTEIRKLTYKGVEEFTAFLEKLREGGKPDRPDFNDPALSEPMICTASVDPDKKFSTRFKMGKYVDKILEDCSKEERHECEATPGFWAWLAALWFDQLCPKKDGHFRPGKDDTVYVPEYAKENPDPYKASNTWGRHAVRTSYLLVNRYEDLVDFILSNPMHIRGELTEALTGRGDFLECRPVVEAMAKLYRDPNKLAPRRGSAGKGAGSARRFAKLTRQLLLNYDLYSLDAEALCSMLPHKEFQRFLDQATAH